MTIRSRMALGFSFLVALMLTVVAAATYQLLRSTLLSDIERDVARRAAAFSAAPPEPRYELDVFSAPDIFLQIVDATGKPLASSGNLSGRSLPVPPATLAGRVAEVHVEDRPLFLTTAPLGDGTRIIVARSPKTTYGALRQLRRLLTLVGAVALVSSAALAWAFARAGLRPVGRLIAAAADVRSSRDLSRRVEERRRPDEVARLAATFNAMLAELEDAYRSLDQSNQRLRQFLADCAHELRAPLTLMMSNLDVLAKAGEGDPVFRNQALRDIRLEAERMARMVTQLLILARADVGGSFDQDAVSLADLVADTCRREESIAIRIRFANEATDLLEGVVVRGSADYLRQALLILIDNAIKYTPAGGEVRVGAERDDGTVSVTVSDTGCGIEQADLPRIFERFYRGRNSDGVSGTGLGLAIALWVAEQHGGKIEVESTPGHGSRFHLVLPIDQA